MNENHIRRDYAAHELPREFEGRIANIKPFGPRGLAKYSLIEIVLENRIAKDKYLEDHRLVSYDPEGHPCHHLLHDRYSVLLRHPHEGPIALAPLHIALVGRKATCSASYSVERGLHWLTIDMNVHFSDWSYECTYSDRILLEDPKGD